MNVLWITNTLFPEAQTFLLGNKDFKSSGGWLLGASEHLSKIEGVSLSIVTMSKLVNKLTYISGINIKYIIIPYCSNSFGKKVRTYLQDIKNEVNPDIVHIHGTEYPLGLSYVQVFGSENVVVSIQGLVGEISKYYTYGISLKNVFFNYTLRDLLFGSILTEKKRFKKKAKHEYLLLQSVKHVIGRTTFDYAHSLSINSKIRYHFCNETLREEFYTNTWSYEKCNKHTIFLSQASYPIKGLHLFLNSLPFVSSKYPDLNVFIAGFDITCKNGSMKRKLFVPGYGLYIKRMINKLQLNNVVHFTGALNADEIKEQLLKANVFICPSTVENSPNSLGEAQLLGVPCIASYVGGVPDMILNKNCGLLYRCEDYKMLARRIIETFDKSSYFDSTEMRTIAHDRHNPQNNLDKLVSIYNSILNKK